MKTKEEIYFKKKKCILNKLFVNCIKLKKGEAKRIIKNGKDLSIKDFKWDIPLDLKDIAKSDVNKFETFISLGRWKNSYEKRQTKFILIARKRELIFLEPEIIKIMYNSIMEEQK